MTAWFVLLAIGSYILGSVPAAYLAMKWSRGVDIRKVGTGKSGASNVLRSGSKWLALPVAVFDIGKGFLAVVIAQLIGLPVWQQVVVGLMAVIGHNWPVFLKFQGGGRGVFASLGVITGLSWQIGLIVMVLAYAWAPVKQVALGVFIAYLALPLLSWFFWDAMGIDERLPVTAGFIGICCIGFIKRLIAHRSELSKGVPWGEIVLNRLLFDRDIGDRRLWTIGSAKKGK